MTNQVFNSVKQNGPHNYSIKIFTIGETGLEDSGKRYEMELVRGSKIQDGSDLPGAQGITIPKQDGMITEQLLMIAEKYLTSVNKGDMITKETSMAITKIQEALMWMNKRSEDRARRNVLATYKK